MNNFRQQTPISIMTHSIRPVLFLLPALLLSSLSCTKESGGTRVQPGEPLPAFRTATVWGREVSTADFLGKPSVVILFDTRCPDCHRQLPELEAAWAAAGELVNVIAVARDEGREAVTGYWQQAGYTMPVAAPGDRRIYDLFDRGSGSGVPQMYISSPGGVVVGSADDTRVMTAEEISEILSRELEKTLFD